MAYIVYCKTCKKILYTKFDATNSIVSSQPHYKDQCLKCYAKDKQLEIKKIQHQASQLKSAKKSESKVESKTNGNQEHGADAS